MKRAFWIVAFLAALLTIVAGCGGVPAPPPAPTPTSGVVEAQVVATPAPQDESEIMLKAPEPNPKRGGILKTACGMCQGL